MPVLFALRNVPLRTASFSLPDRWLLWSKARLYANRLMLHGWGLCERYRRRISLETIEQVNHEEKKLVLHLTDGSTLTLLMSNPAQWSTAIRTHREVHEQGE